MSGGDYHQTVESAVKNKDASDRVKAAQALGLAEKGYTAYMDSMREFSLGNSVNAKDIRITATEGDIRAKQTDFTSRDSEGKWQADSRIQLNAYKDLILESGQSAEKFKGKQQSAGFESGVGFAVGAQTGLYIYAQAGFTQGKQEERHVTQHNSHLDTAQLSLTSGGDTTLSGAVAKANRIDADIKGNLRIESRQDEHLSKSSSSGGGLRVQGGIGTAWGASGYANASSGKANSNQVMEQSGLFAEEGGYHINADNVHLKGAAIASTNATNSELKTNKLTFEDIQNESQSRAISGGISGSANLTKAMGNAPITGAQAKQQSEFAKLTGTSQSNHLSPTVPMYDSEQDRSITKATLTEGRITLNKDSAPRETTAAELGINTDLTEANRQVSAPKDIQKVLKEQQVLSQAIGNIAEATSRYSEQQAQRLEKEAAEAAQQGDSQTAKNKQEEAKKWQTGGEHKRKVEALTNAISLALAGKSTEAIATGVASPYINEQIKKVTKTMPGLNIPAHILWGAIEAELAGGKAATGAIAAGVGEASADIFAKGIYGKSPNELTGEEKQNVLTLSKVAAGVAGGLTANGNRAENLATLSTGITVAENAVEHNAMGMVGASHLSYVLARNDENCDTQCKEKLDQLQLNNANAQLKGSVITAAAIVSPLVTTESMVIAGGFGSGSELIGQLIEHKGDIAKVDKTKVAISGVTGIVTRNMGILSTAATNSAVEAGDALRAGKEPWKEAAMSFITTTVGGAVGKTIETPLNHKLNPAWKINYLEKKGHLPYEISESYKPSIVPSVVGNTVDNVFSSGVIKPELEKRYNKSGAKNEK
ncbi:hemagglutinin repeat-containing protein [Rodentibacter caecimuris]|uniref:hemagglutinin repeat-containing protein n=1 Tax=Rodentibacter caecimuris TaxID=1796644 RepID=UPI002119D24B|nr:hemagglutinin repeat-containing protein [Rodentibacter heylii]